MLVKGYDVYVQPTSLEITSGYAAVVSALPGCVSEGDTPEEAMEGVGRAIDSWLRKAAEFRQAASVSSQAYWLAF